MNNTIDQFIWGFQPHFRLFVESGIKRALSAIGLPVEPRVMLVGFALDKSLHHQICIEPETGPLSVDHLAAVPARAQELFEADPEFQLFHSDPRIHELRRNGLFLRSRANALVEAIEASGAFQGMSFFVSNSAPINSYAVHTVVGVPSDALNSLPSLAHSVIDRIHVGRSLQHEVIAECLHKADLALHLPDPGSGFLPLGMAEDIIRTAAMHLADGATYRAIGQPADLFDSINAFTSLSYERTGARGHIVVVSDEEATARLSVRFQQSVSLSNARRIRKILELSDDSLAVLVDQRGAYGLGACASGTNVLDISVTDHAQWEMSIDGLALMRVDHGKATLPKPLLDFRKFTDTVERVLGSVEVKRLWAIIEKAQASNNGMTLVVSSDPRGEATRLGAEAVPIEPQYLGPTEIARLGHVDGAVLLGPNGFCHAFSVILDGTATGRGDPGRGSRYNSAIRYQQSTTAAPSVIVVISDDGTVDLIPHLRPRVYRKDIETAVQEFVACCLAEPVDGSTFSRTLKRVESFDFYLNEQQCRIVNEHYENEMRKRFEAGGLRLSRKPFQPHPDMNDSYFL